MERSRRAAALLLLAAACISLPVAVRAQAGQAQSRQAQDVASVRRVQVLGNRTPVEIEIEASDRLVPRTQVLTGPDRLVVDFANTVPGAQLRNQTLNHGEVKSVRVGLFASKPPVTRVVFDLNGPQAYQVFPAGRTVIIKVGTVGVQASAFKPASSGVKLLNSNYPVQSLRITPPEPPPLVVTFQEGLLHVTSNKANLSEVLFAIHQHTGAEIAIPAGAEQEQVVAEIGPAPAPEVLSHLLNGSKFNFLILSSANDPATLDRVILSARPEGPAPTYRSPAQVRPQDDTEAEVTRRDAPPPAEAPVPAGANQASPSPPATTAPSNNDVPD
jgi:hypothetical protein